MSKGLQLIVLAWHRLLLIARQKPKREFSQAMLFWVLAGTIPVVTIFSTHVWLRTAYTGGVFHLQGFLDQYDSGIYRYRILGRELLLSIYRILLSLFHDRPLTMPRDPDATTLFYGSYIILNGLCFAFTNFLILLMLSDRKRRIGDINLAFYLYITLIQVFAMDIVSPYDQLAYLLIMLSLYAVTISKEWIGYSLLTFAAIAGALTRETQSLVTPALFSIAIFSAKRSRRFWISGCCNLLAFASVYIVLRIVIPGHGAVSGPPTYGGKWPIESGLVLAMLFFVSSCIVFRIYSDTRPTLMLLILSGPYLATILFSGVLRELRLLVPILLTQMFVYLQLKLDLGNNIDDRSLCGMKSINIAAERGA